MVVGSLLHEFQIEEKHGNEWNVMGHGGYSGYGHECFHDFWIGQYGWA
jgi:hypothetical protein